MPQKPMKDEKEDSKENHEEIGDYSDLKKEINHVLNICKSIIKSTGSTEKCEQSGDDGEKSTKQNVEDEEKSSEITLEKVAQDISTILKDLKDHLDTFQRKNDSFSDVIPKLEKSLKIESKQGFFKKAQQNLDPAYNPQNCENYIPQKKPITSPVNNNFVLKSKNSSNQSKTNNFFSNNSKPKESSIQSTTPKVATSSDNHVKNNLINNNLPKVQNSQTKTPNTNRVIPTPKSAEDKNRAVSTPKAAVDNNRAAPVPKPSVDNKRVAPAPKSADSNKKAVTNPKLNEPSNQVAQFSKHDSTQADVNCNNREKYNRNNNQSSALILTPKSEAGITTMVRENIFNKLMVPFSTSAKDQVKIIPYNTAEIPGTSLFATADYKSKLNLNENIYMIPSTTESTENVIETKLSYLMPSIYSFHQFIMLSAQKAQEDNSNRESSNKIDENNVGNKPKDDSVAVAPAVGGNFTDKSLSIKIGGIKARADPGDMHERNNFLETKLNSDANANARNNFLVKSSPDPAKSKNQNKRPHSAKPNLKSNESKSRNNTLKGNVTGTRPKTAQLDLKAGANYKNTSLDFSSGRNVVRENKKPKPNCPVEVKKNSRVKSKSAKVSSGSRSRHDNSFKSSAMEMKHTFVQSAPKTNLNEDNKNLDNKTVQKTTQVEIDKILKTMSLRPKSAPVCLKNSVAQLKVITVCGNKTSNSHSSNNSSTQTKRAKSSSRTKSKSSSRENKNIPKLELREKKCPVRKIQK